MGVICCKGYHQIMNNNNFGCLLIPRGLDPLDFSFKCLCSLTDLEDELPRPRENKELKCKEIVEYVTKAPVNTFLFDEEKENLDDDEDLLLSRKSNKKEQELEQVVRKVYVATAIRLNNNSLSDLSQLQPVMAKILVNWEWLAWVDLSFNDITTLDISFTSFPELRLIYLHGNSIDKINEIEKLTEIEHLHTLTLHGNPIEMLDNYRYHVITKIPYLKSLDFSAVTKQERNLSTRRRIKKR